MNLPGGKLMLARLLVPSGHHEDQRDARVDEARVPDLQRKGLDEVSGRIL